MSNHGSLEAEDKRKFAPPPFDDLDADVIICSSDGILFRSFKAVLARASPHFANMFTLPLAPPATTDTWNYIGGVPMVRVTEKADEMTQFLSFCHPEVQKPSPQTAYEVYQLYKLGDKYMVDSLLEYVKRELSRLTAGHPVGVYMVASHLGWNEEAVKAARESLKLSPDDFFGAGGMEMKFISADMLKNLHKYRHQVERNLVHSTDSAYWYQRDLASWVDPLPDYLFDRPPMEHSESMFPANCCCRKLSHEIVDLDPGLRSHFGISGHEVVVLGWFDTYLRDLRVALQKIPGRTDIDGIVFMEGAWNEAQRCPECRPIAMDVFNALSFAMKTWAVDRFIDQVKVVV